MRSPRLLISVLLLPCGGAAAAQPEVDLDLVEYHFDGHNSFYFDGSIAYGSPNGSVIAKLTTGGSIGRRIDQVDGQLLYGRELGRGITAVAGVRHEFRPHPHFTYAVAGLIAAPSDELELEATSFLSERGDLLAEIKAVYDQPLAPRVVLQPRVTFNLAAQGVADQGLAAGVTDAEFGLRLRYELNEWFAPHVGISHERLIGKTRDLARAANDPVSVVHFVVGFSSAF